MLLFSFGIIFGASLFNVAELVKTCGPDEFPCNDGSCVDKTKWCDTRLDCDDDSDELYCFLKSPLVRNPNRCNETVFFLCQNGECIPAIGRCDGFSSCLDNSDEENCDVAESISNVSVSFTKPPVKGDYEGPSLSLNGNDSKAFGKLHENLMQADYVPHTDLSAENKSISSVSASKASEHLSPNINMKQSDQHEPLKVNISTDFGNKVSKKETNEGGFKPLVPMDHRKALEFRDVISMLNTSRNVTSHVNFDPTPSLILPNRSLNHKLNSGDEQTPDNPNSQNNQSYNSNLYSIQRDSVSAKSSFIKEQDLYKGYVKLRSQSFQKAKDRALQWVIDSRDSDYGWGEETARGIITLRMADYSSGKPGDNQLMSKQLHLKLFTLMNRNKTEVIPLGDLALYINALSASCDNAKNFHGYDLVNILRQRTNVAEGSSRFVTPFVYLVLCLHNASSYADVGALRNMLSDWNITRIDSEAMISLAATCISRKPEIPNVGIGRIAAKRLYNKIAARGLPRNIYEIALLTQALNEAGIDHNLWNRSEAMRRITEAQNKDGSFGDILATYYAVPTLSGRSFLLLGTVCPETAGLGPLEVLKNSNDEKMYVRYALRFGSPLKMSQSIMMQVQKNCSFMNIMRIAAVMNPTYRFKYDMSEGKPTVYSIGGIANDAERGLYWAPYTSTNATSDLVPFEGDIRNFIPALEEYVAFWRKPMF